VNTEKTVDIGETQPRGWLCFDAHCPFCSSFVSRFQITLQRRGFEPAPLQAAWVAARLGPTPGAIPDEMKLLLADGSILGGADAVVRMAGTIWWAWPLHFASRIPGVILLLRWLYRRIAERRACLNGTCRLDTQPLRRSLADHHHGASTAFFEMP